MSTAAARQACSFFLGRLDAEVARLRATTFSAYHVGPQKWLALISGIIETGSGYLSTAANPATAAPDAADLLRDAETLGGIAYKFLEQIAGADSSEIPQQIIAPFERWARELGIDQTTIYRAQHLPNYELAHFDYKQAVRDIRGGTAKLLDVANNKIKWPVLRVTVPGQAMGMLPHFAVVAHELGHAIQDLINADLTPHHQLLNDAANAILKRLDRQNLDLPEIMEFADILKRWVNELKADAVGFHLVGPAFFFALFGFLELAFQGYGVIRRANLTPVEG